MSFSAPARERLTLALAAIAVLATRLPWIGSGYGSDPDGYRVVIVARQIAHSGVYEASRLPGFPAYEYLTALSAWSAPWVSNAVTALFSVASFVLFAMIARELGVRRYLLLALAFAMTPVVYLSSCCTMDYMPALAGQLAATYALLRRRPVLAGVLLGLGMGCRITAGALALPLCLWILLSSARAGALRQCLRFGITLLLTAALCFVPVWRRYGADFFSFYDNDWYPPFDVVFARALPLVWGALGLVAVALYRAAFLRLPDEAAYLLPAVPFALLAIALLTPPGAVVALTAA